MGLLLNRTRLELVEDAPVLCHDPRRCSKNGGQVHTFRRTHPGDEPETELVCWECKEELGPDEVLTQAEAEELDRLLAARYVVLMKGRPSEFQPAYIEALQQVRRLVPAGR